MIKYFIRHYWRYLAMALAFATISFFINSCEVNAEVNFINPTDMTYKNPLDSNPTYGTNCSADGYSCVYLDNGNESYSRFYTGNAGYNFPYSQLAVFNFSVVRRDSDQDTTIGSISLNGFSCYFNSTQSYTSNEQGSGDNTLEPYKTSVSAYCPLSGTFAINGRTKILEIRYTNQANISYVMLNRITFVSNGEVDRLIQLLSSSNSYFITNNDLLSQINSKMLQVLSKEDTTNNYLNTIEGDLQKIIENNQVCKYYDKNIIELDNKGIQENGNIQNVSNYGVTKYIKISGTSKIKKISDGTSVYYAIAFYNINKEFIRAINNNTITLNQSLTIPRNAEYIRFTIRKSDNQPQWEICDTSQNIQNQQNEEIINSQKETNDTLKDSSTDDPTNDLDEMNENEISNSVISDLLLLPINMFQNILNAVNGTCSNFSLGALFGTTLVLPCINIENLIGSTLWGVIDILFCGIFVLSMRKKFVDIFENITSLKDRGNEIE